MECIQNEKRLNTDINKLNWRFNYVFSDHKAGLLLYAMMIIFLLSGDIERHPGPDSWTTIKHPNFFNYLRVCTYKIFLGEKLLPDPKDGKDDSLTIDVCDGFADRKNLFGQHYQAHIVELKSLKKINSRFMVKMKNWGKEACFDRDQYCEIFSPSNWKNLDNSVKKTYNHL